MTTSNNEPREPWLGPTSDTRRVEFDDEMRESLERTRRMDIWQKRVLIFILGLAIGMGIGYTLAIMLTA